MPGLAVQASGGWIIRAFRGRGREEKERETETTQGAICHDFTCRSGN